MQATVSREYSWSSVVCPSVDAQRPLQLLQDQPRAAHVAGRAAADRHALPADGVEAELGVEGRDAVDATARHPRVPRDRPQRLRRQVAEVRLHRLQQGDERRPASARTCRARGPAPSMPCRNSGYTTCRSEGDSIGSTDNPTIMAPPIRRRRSSCCRTNVWSRARRSPRRPPISAPPPARLLAVARERQGGEADVEAAFRREAESDCGAACRKLLHTQVERSTPRSLPRWRHARSSRRSKDRSGPGDCVRPGPVTGPSLPTLGPPRATQRR